ncbi:MAG: hypothetical protein ACRDZR_16315 [Acidimicrobiales bacterium]
MKRPLHLGAATAALVAIAGLAGSPVAGAAASTPYALKASAVGTKLTLAGTTFVGGTSSASAGSSAAAQAQGAGELSPAAVGSQEATASAPGTSQTLPQSCAQPSVPFPAPLGSLFSLGEGCSSASAAESSGALPTASASGQIASVSVNASPTALPVPVTPKSTVVSTLGGVLGTLPSLPTTGLPLGTVLLLLASASNTSLSSLVGSSLGSSTSSVSATSTTADARSQAAGSTIGLLNGLGAGGGALLTVTLGQAVATVSLDRTTGKVTASDTPAAVSVTLDSPVTGSQSFAVAPGASQTFLTGTPLATTVAAGSGTATSGTGTGSASADGVTIHALQGLGATTATGSNGGLDISLASATASITATVPVTTAAATPAPPPPAPAPAVTGATTVHTGEPWAGPLPLALLGLMMLAGLVLVSRRRLLWAAHRVSALARGASLPPGGQPPGPASGTSSVPPPVSGPARRQPPGCRTV